MTAKHRSLRWFLFLSLSTLAASALSLGWLFNHSPAGEGPSPGGAVAPPAPLSQGVVCSGYVDLEHGCTALYPLQPGRVARVLVRENDTVQAGTAILGLEDQAARARVQEARAAVEAAQAQLEQAQKAPKRHQVRLALQKSAVEAAKNRLSAARHLLARKEQLQNRNLINTREVAAAEDQIMELEALRDAELQKLNELQLHDPLLDVRRAEAEAAGVQAKLRQAEQALEECILKAPGPGTVVRILVTPGEVLAVPPRQAAVIFAADEPRIVRAEVEQEFADRVAVGQAAQVQDESNAQLIWRGKVTYVSDWYLQRRSIFLEPTRFNDTRTLECIITLDPGHPPLRIGQRVRVLTGPGGP